MPRGGPFKSYRRALPRARERRQELGLTAEAVAERIGISWGQLCRVERGENRVHSDDQEKLAAVLELPVDDLFAAPETNPKHAERVAQLPALRAQGLGQQAIAREFHCGPNYVRGYLDEAGLPRTLPEKVLAPRLRVHALPREHHDERARETAKRKQDGESYRKIAADIGCSTSDVGPYLDSAGEPRSPTNHEVALAHRERLQKMKAISAGKVAEINGMTASAVSRYLQLGVLPVAEILPLHGATHIKAIQPKDARALLRDRHTSGNWYCDPDNMLDFAAGELGLDYKRAKELAQRVSEARERAAHVRVGTGRPPSPGPPAYHFEWARRFVELKAELVARYDAYHVASDKAPTNWETAAIVAEEDFDEHPERWEYSPYEARRNAAQRVWDAVKPLLIAQAETRAA